MQIKTSRYYEEFLRYYKMADDQQALCNLGSTPHISSGIPDDLMLHVELYDVIERKFAGFSQIVNDIFYGWSQDHPYWSKMQAGSVTWQREKVAKAWSGKRAKLGLAEWLYLFILHRVTGSAINYGTKPSGYHNSILFHLHSCDTIEEMVEIVKNYPKPFYTSIGYQFPAFPKPPVGSTWKRGGDYYLAEYAPRLSRELADWLQKEGKKSMREIGDWMFEWNQNNGLRAYRFQYAATIADIADWFPEFVHLDSMFYYGTNAVECIGYLADPIAGKGKKSHDFLDAVMERIMRDTGGMPYNAEDVACDFIRWVENYVRPGDDYSHLDYDSVWSSSKIEDHPFGRQKAMLDLGIVNTFNGMTAHPSDDKVLSMAGISALQYKEMVQSGNSHTGDPVSLAPVADQGENSPNSVRVNSLF